MYLPRLITVVCGGPLRLLQPTFFKILRYVEMLQPAFFRCSVGSINSGIIEIIITKITQLTILMFNLIISSYIRCNSSTYYINRIAHTWNHFFAQQSNSNICPAHLEHHKHSSKGTCHISDIQKKRTRKKPIIKRDNILFIFSSRMSFFSRQFP